MSTQQTSQSLEVLHQAASGKPRTPLLFVHGAYAGAWIWQEHYLSFFAERGWPAYALSLPGHGASRGREYLDSLSIDDYVKALRETAASLPARPVLVGHSMGGMVVQKLLEHEDAPGVVLMAAVPPQGLLSAAVGMMFSKPHLMFELNSFMGGSSPQRDTLCEALFHGPVSAQRMHDIFIRCQPESTRALWDMSMFSLPNPARMRRPPMLVLGAAEDQLIPVSDVENTGKAYGVTPQIFPDMGHGMMLEDNWQGPAQFIADWLQTQGL